MLHRSGSRSHQSFNQRCLKRTLKCWEAKSGLLTTYKLCSLTSLAHSILNWGYTCLKIYSSVPGPRRRMPRIYMPTLPPSKSSLLTTRMSPAMYSSHILCTQPNQLIPGVPVQLCAPPLGICKLKELLLSWSAGLTQQKRLHCKLPRLPPKPRKIEKSGL